MPFKVSLEFELLEFWPQEWVALVSLRVRVASITETETASAMVRDSLQSLKY